MGFDIKDYLKYYKINLFEEIKIGYIGVLFGILNVVKDGLFYSEEDKRLFKIEKLNEDLKGENLLSNDDWSKDYDNLKIF